MSQGGAGAAARLLRAHGITLLPADDGSTVLNALQSGRTVVLSGTRGAKPPPLGPRRRGLTRALIFADAGKLMLKESGSPRDAAAAPGAGDDEADSAVPAPGAGVVLTATPVLAPPPGVKVFTLSNASKLAGGARPAAEAGGAPRFVQLPAAAGAGAAGGGATLGRGALAAAALRAAAARPAVKIVMSRANFRKLVATAHKASPPAAAPSADDSVVVVPEQFVRSASPQYLRSQLLCAHAALQELAAELRAAEARLALYEPRAP